MIDIHTHLHPPRLFAAIRRWFAERSDWDLRAQPTSPSAVAGVLRAAGVQRFVFCSYAHKPTMARELNAWLAAASAELGGYGLPLATVHLDDLAPLDDLRAALDAGCVGLKVHEDVQRLAIDDARWEPLFAELARRGRFLLVHVGPIPWHYEAGPGLRRVAGVLARHPQLDVVVAHLGVPDTAGYVALMTEHPHVHLDTTMVCAPGSPMRDLAAGEFLRARPDRMLYGTDFPNVPHAYGAERAGLERLGLSAAALRDVLAGNAQRLLQRAAGDGGRR